MTLIQHNRRCPTSTRTQEGKGIYILKREASEGTGPAPTLIPDFQPSGLGGNTFDLPVLPKACCQLWRCRPPDPCPRPWWPRTAGPSELPGKPPVQARRGRCHVFPPARAVVFCQQPGSAPRQGTVFSFPRCYLELRVAAHSTPTVKKALAQTFQKTQYLRRMG